MTEAKSLNDMRKNFGGEILDLVPSKVILNVDSNNNGKIDGYQFDLKNPFYNAEPIGAIKNLLISIDGEKVNPKNVSLIVKNQKIQLLNAHTIVSIWWPSYQNIQVFVAKPGGLKVVSHELDCTLHLTSTFVYGFEFRDSKGIPYLEFFVKKTINAT